MRSCHSCQGEEDTGHAESCPYVEFLVEETVYPAGFLPPSGAHDATCAYLCRYPKSSCSHQCAVCQAKIDKEL